MKVIDSVQNELKLTKKQHNYRKFTIIVAIFNKEQKSREQRGLSQTDSLSQYDPEVVPVAFYDLESHHCKLIPMNK